MAWKPGGPKEGPSKHYLIARGLIKPPSPQPVRKPRGTRTPRKAPNPAVLVYFIKAVTLGHIKIGKADCVHTRFRTLRCANADVLQMLGAIVTTDGTALERQLHQHFAKDRLHGEWFQSSPELLAYIAEHAKTPPAMRHWRETREGV